MTADKECCATCGFFMRSTSQTDDLRECIEIHRHWAGFDQTDHGTLQCSKRLADLDLECRRVVDGPPHGEYPQGVTFREAVSHVINHDRECVGWRKWNPLRSPKEHEDMDIIERVQRAQEQTVASAKAANAIAMAALVVSAIAVIVAPIFASLLTWFLTRPH